MYKEISTIFQFFGKIDQRSAIQSTHGVRRERRREKTREERIGVCETLDIIRDRLGANDVNYTLQKAAIDPPYEAFSAC